MKKLISLFAMMFAVTAIFAFQGQKAPPDIIVSAQIENPIDLCFSGAILFEAIQVIATQAIPSLEFDGFNHFMGVGAQIVPLSDEVSKPSNTDPPPIGGDMEDWFSWIVILVIAVLELLFRFIPSTAKITPLTLLYNLFDSFVPNSTGENEKLSIRKVSRDS